MPARDTDGGTRSSGFYTDQGIVRAWIADGGLPRFGGTLLTANIVVNESEHGKFFLS